MQENKLLHVWFRLCLISKIYQVPARSSPIRVVHDFDYTGYNGKPTPFLVPFVEIGLYFLFPLNCFGLLVHTSSLPR